MATIYSNYWLREHPWLPEPDERSTSKEERARHNEEYFIDVLKREFAAGKRFYAVHYGSIACFCSVHENSIENFVMRFFHYDIGKRFAKMLAEFAETKCIGTPKISAYGPKGKKWLAELEEMGYIECGTGEENIVFFSKYK